MGAAKTKVRRANKHRAPLEPPPHASPEPQWCARKACMACHWCPEALRSEGSTTCSPFHTVLEPLTVSSPSPTSIETARPFA